VNDILSVKKPYLTTVVVNSCFIVDSLIRDTCVDYCLMLCFVCNADKSRGKDKELDSSKQMKDKPKRPTDKSNADQQKQKNSDGRYVCLSVAVLTENYFMLHKRDH